MEHIESFIRELKNAGYSPDKVVLFGSYAYGRLTDISDIDLAVWDKRFTGCGSVDVAPIASIISKYPQLELHPFNSQESENPFAETILNRGILINL